MLQTHEMLRSYWRPGVIAGLLGTILVVPWLGASPQMRKATATLKVIPSSDDEDDYARGIAGQIERMRSSAVLQSVMRRLDLVHDAVFVDGFEGPSDQLLRRVQAALMAALQVQPGKNGEVRLTATYPSAAKAAQIANAVAEEYLRMVANNDHGTMPCTDPSVDSVDPDDSGDCAIDSKQERFRVHSELERLSAKMDAARDRVTALVVQHNMAVAPIPVSLLTPAPMAKARRAHSHRRAAPVTHRALPVKHTGLVQVSLHGKHTAALQVAQPVKQHTAAVPVAQPVKRTAAAQVAQPVKHTAAVQVAQPGKNTPAERSKALRRAAGQDLVIEAARAELDSARTAYFKVLDCYATSHSLCMAVSAPKVAQLMQGAAAPVEASVVEASVPGSKDMVLLMAFVAASVLGCCRPLPLGHELPRKLEPVATPA